MADLSVYISFSAVLDKSGSIPVLKLIDTSSYPVGVPPLIKGCFTVIRQPDGIAIGNSNFSSPDIQYTGSGLNQFTTELRLNNVFGFQTGGYLITYSVQATGYTQTTLTRTFNLQYTRPTATIVSNFNNFQPSLTVQDGTTYTMSGFNLVGVTHSWAGVIDSVNGVVKNIAATTQVFDLAYLGSYYDANFNVTMTSIVSWTLAAPGNFVTIIDSFIENESFDSETPPSLLNLLGNLTFLKAQLDAAIANCLSLPWLLANYLLSQAVFSHLKYRGCANDFAGLSAYVYQLQKIFNNNVTPPIDHTDLPIPVYDFGCGGGGGGSTDWTNITNKPVTVIITWTVGDAGFPGSGANSITDSRLQGYRVLVMRNNIQELGFTKALSDQTVTFNNVFSTGEVLYIQSIPL